MPAELLEKEIPAAFWPSGPGAPFVLHPAGAPPRQFETGELPADYGTQRLHLTARDPHCLYAFWDFSPEQKNHLLQHSADARFYLRVFGEGERMVLQTALAPQAQSSFLPIEKSGAAYRAELGFYDRSGGWRSAALSERIIAPPDETSADQPAQFVTLPPQIRLDQLTQAVREAMTGGAPPAAAIQPAAATVAIPAALIPPSPTPISATLPSPTPPALGPAAFTRPEIGIRPEPTPVHLAQIQPLLSPIPPAFAAGWRAPAERAGPTPPSAARAVPLATAGRMPQPEAAWSPERARALASALRLDNLRRALGSFEASEQIRREWEEALPGAEAGAPPIAGPERAPPPAPAISSFAGEAAKVKEGFWFNVNAELVIYGATEREAQLTIGGRTIRLRPDGAFSFRFALPDGEYSLPIQARSRDGAEERSADLHFRRRTEIRGDAGAHPQDAALRAPNLADLE